MEVLRGVLARAGLPRGSYAGGADEGSRWKARQTHRNTDGVGRAPAGAHERWPGVHAPRRGARGQKPGTSGCGSPVGQTLPPATNCRPAGAEMPQMPAAAAAFDDHPRPHRGRGQGEGAGWSTRGMCGAKSGLEGALNFGADWKRCRACPLIVALPLLRKGRGRSRLDNDHISRRSWPRRAGVSCARGRGRWRGRTRGRRWGRFRWA